MGLVLSHRWWPAIALVMIAACSSPEQKIEKFLAEAEALYSQGEYAKAGISYRNVLRIQANNVEALYGIARVAEQRGNLQASFQAYLRLVDLAPGHVQGRVKLGKIYLAAGQLDMALQESQAASERAPEDADVLALNAAVRFRLADIEGAVRDANLALAAAPGKVDALMILAAERLAADDPKAAIGYLDRGLEGKEDNVALQVFKIQALEQLEQIDQAVEVFNRLIGFYPDNAAFHHALARLYIRHDDIDSAESVYRNLAALQPGDASARMDVIRFMLAYRDEAAAEQQLLEYIKESPDDYALRFGLAEIFLQSTRADGEARARAVYEQIAARSGNGANGLAARNQLAIMALAEGDQETAERLVDLVLSADTRNAEGLITRARIQLQARETEAAIASLRAVLKDEPYSSQALLMLARAHRQSGAPELAADYYTRAIRADTSQVATSLEYALFLIREQSFDQAEQVLAPVLAAQPWNADALKAMARVKVSQQDWQAAQDLADRLQGLEGEQAVAGQIEGLALQGLEQYQESIEAFERAHEASPTAAQPMVALVRAYLQMGKTSAARSFLESVLSLDKDNVYAMVMLGQLSLLEEDSAAAERSFRAAIATAPENQAGYSNLVSLYVQDGRYEEAKAVLDQGLQLDPDSLNLRMRLAGVLERSGDAEGAIAIYEDILDENPNVDVAANNLASALTRYRADEESLQRALKLAERFRSSDMPYYQDTLGWIYHRMGRNQDALPLLEDAVEAMPEFPEFRYHLGMSYLNTNQAEKARVELQQAMSLARDGFPGVEEARRALEQLSAP